MPGITVRQHPHTDQPRRVYRCRPIEAADQTTPTSDWAVHGIRILEWLGRTGVFGQDIHTESRGPPASARLPAPDRKTTALAGSRPPSVVRREWNTTEPDDCQPAHQSTRSYARPRTPTGQPDRTQNRRQPLFTMRATGSSIRDRLSPLQRHRTTSKNNGDHDKPSNISTASGNDQPGADSDETRVNGWFRTRTDRLRRRTFGSSADYFFSPSPRGSVYLSRADKRGQSGALSTDTSLSGSDLMRFPSSSPTTTSLAGPRTRSGSQISLSSNATVTPSPRPRLGHKAKSESGFRRRWYSNFPIFRRSSSDGKSKCDGDSASDDTQPRTTKARLFDIEAEEMPPQDWIGAFRFQMNAYSEPILSSPSISPCSTRPSSSKETPSTLFDRPSSAGEGGDHDHNPTYESDPASQEQIDRHRRVVSKQRTKILTYALKHIYWLENHQLEHRPPTEGDTFSRLQRLKFQVYINGLQSRMTSAANRDLLFDSALELQNMRIEMMERSKKSVVAAN